MDLLSIDRDLRFPSPPIVRHIERDLTSQIEWDRSTCGTSQFLRDQFGKGNAVEIAGVGNSPIDKIRSRMALNEVENLKQLLLGVLRKLVLRPRLPTSARITLLEPSLRPPIYLSSRQP